MGLLYARTGQVSEKIVTECNQAVVCYPPLQKCCFQTFAGYMPAV